jgi:hypothetical protein
MEMVAATSLSDIAAAALETITLGWRSQIPLAWRFVCYGSSAKRLKKAKLISDLRRLPQMLKGVTRTPLLKPSLAITISQSIVSHECLNFSKTSLEAL